MLDVLYVKLKMPPKSVQIDGLPENVVPLTRSTVSITCRFPDGNKISISRSQIEVLPNFAMTDFASQGKTRPYNPVDLNNCRSHQAYYTALSRSSTAEGTIILQSFDPKKITGKASGALRQEFRDLELLDEITKLHYLGKLPGSVNGDTRSALIHTYRLHKGMTYVPQVIHPSIKWSKKDPMLEPIADNLPWKINPTESGIDIKFNPEISQNVPSNPINKRNGKEITPETERTTKIAKTDAIVRNYADPIDMDDIQPIIPHKSHKRKAFMLDEGHKRKITKTNSETRNCIDGLDMDIQALTPKGTRWHQNSCAYDAVLCIIHGIWSSNKGYYTNIFTNANDDILGNLASNFAKHASGTKTLESTRDDLRHILHQLAPSHFGWGQFTSISTLMEYILSMPSTTVQSDFLCKNGHISRTRRINNTCCVLQAGAKISAT